MNKSKITNLKPVFDSPSINIQDSVVFYDSPWNETPKEIPPEKLDIEEGPPNQTSTIYIQETVYNPNGEQFNKETCKNIQKVKLCESSHPHMVALKYMKYGQKAVFKINVPELPSDVKVIQFGEKQDDEPPYRVHVIHMTNYVNEKKQPNEYTFEERLVKAHKLRNQASLLFKEGKYDEARLKYDQIRIYVSSIPKAMRQTWTQEQINQIEGELITSHINKAVTFVKQNKYIDAKNQLQEALKIDSKNIKALFLIGRCYFEVSNKIDAKNTFNQLLTLNITSEVRGEVEFYLRKLNPQKDELMEQKVAKHIMSKLSEIDPEEEERKRKAKIQRINAERLQQETLQKLLQGNVNSNEELDEITNQNNGIQ